MLSSTRHPFFIMTVSCPFRDETWYGYHAIDLLNRQAKKYCQKHHLPVMAVFEECESFSDYRNVHLLDPFLQEIRKVVSTTTFSILLELVDFRYDQEEQMYYYEREGEEMYY